MWRPGATERGVPGPGAATVHLIAIGAETVIGIGTVIGTATGIATEMTTVMDIMTTGGIAGGTNTITTTTATRMTKDTITTAKSKWANTESRLRKKTGIASDYAQSKSALLKQNPQAIRELFSSDPDAAAYLAFRSHIQQSLGMLRKIDQAKDVISASSASTERKRAAIAMLRGLDSDLSSLREAAESFAGDPDDARR
jgi:hypothetical protein